MRDAANDKHVSRDDMKGLLLLTSHKHIQRRETGFKAIYLVRNMESVNICEDYCW